MQQFGRYRRRSGLRGSPASSGDGQVTLRIADAVAHVLFDRPWARNAMTWAMYDGFAAACAAINERRCAPRRWGQGFCRWHAAAGGGSSPGDLWRYTSPYRGLAAMKEKDSDYFFGRARETVEGNTHWNGGIGASATELHFDIKPLL
jgi:hypothetical protein